jgi:NAD(P)H-hydrate epimerase
MIRLNRQQAREVDRITLIDYYLPGLVLMENAARSVVEQARDMLGGNRAGPVLILAGGGNNGGDGLAAARHLHNLAIDVTIGLTTDPATYKGDALINWNVVSAMKIPTTPVTPALICQSDYRLIIDAIFGTGLSAAPRAPFSSLARAVNHCHRPVLAIDIPSGLDCDTGQPLAPGDDTAIRATRTVTFVAEKAGFANPDSHPWLGQIVIGDIGCPRMAIERAMQGSPRP